jgi:serine protease Do
MRRRKRTIPSLALLVLLGAAGASPGQPPAENPVPTPAAPAVNLRRTVTVEVVQKTKDAVVNISATKLVSQRIQPPGFDPFVLPFDMGQIVQVPTSSLGSGFIIHPDGYVVTNNHVIDRASQISVELANGQKSPAELISADPDADLALLRIHTSTPLPVLSLGESDDLLIGEPVIAVGNPLGFSHTVSTGIVSAVHRNIDPTAEQQSGDPTRGQPLSGEAAALHDLIQTDAAINPGNSGGPLLNVYGQVIGIDTAIRSDAQNIGFAIPIDRLRNLIPELMNPAGVNKVEVPLKLTEQRQMIEPATVVARVVSADSTHRVLESINGQHPGNIVDAYADLLRLTVGTPATITWSDGQTTRLLPRAAPAPDAVVQARARLGATIAAVTPMLAQRLNLTVNQGMLITSVDRDSVADRAGLKPGDVLVRLGRYPVNTLADIAALLPKLPVSGEVHVIVVRGDEVLRGTLEFSGA